MGVAPACKTGVPRDRYDYVYPIAFALGADRRQFQKDSVEGYSLLSFSVLTHDDHITRLRALCTVRNIIMKTYSTIAVEDYQKALSAILHFPMFVLDRLSNDSTHILELTGNTVFERVLQINNLIEEELDYLRGYLPVCNWEWVQGIFSMSHIKTSEAFLNLCTLFSKDIMSYPYRVWVNVKVLTPRMLKSDYYFWWTLHREHGEQLTDIASYKITSAQTQEFQDTLVSRSYKNNLMFLKSHLGEVDAHRVAFLDTQNMKPDVVYSFFVWCSREYSEAFSQVILFSDGTENWRWGSAEQEIPFKVKRISASRVLDDKSTMDTFLIAQVMKYYYEYGCDDFFIFSGDCDFLPLVEALPSAQFCFCSLSDCTSYKASVYARNKNTRYIFLKEFLQDVRIVSGDVNDSDIFCYLVDSINNACISLQGLMQAADNSLYSLGCNVNNSILRSLLNEIFSSYIVKVTDEGFLHFEAKE